MFIQKTLQEMRYPNVTWLYFATRLAFNAPEGEVSLLRSPQNFARRPT